MGTYRERREARAEKLRDWSAKRDEKAAELYSRGDPYRGDIAFATQPGHIPERARVIAATHRAFEHANKAREMESRAAEIERQADRAIYDDDPDAIERLTAKLAKLEAQRENAKTRNAAYRKEHKAELAGMTAYERDQAVPFPAYYGRNLSGLITTTRQRIARLTARAERTGTTAKPARLLALKYAGKCSVCSVELAVGTLAYYDRAERTVTCRPCEEAEK